MALVALIGFIPAIVVFILVYMRFGFKEPALPAAIYASATTLLCWGLFHKLLAWRGRVAARRSLSARCAPHSVSSDE